jgi:hypothetical protein
MVVSRKNRRIFRTSITLSILFLSLDLVVPAIPIVVQGQFELAGELASGHGRSFRLLSCNLFVAPTRNGEGHYFYSRS